MSLSQWVFHFILVHIWNKGSGLMHVTCLCEPVCELSGTFFLWIITRETCRDLCWVTVTSVSWKQMQQWLYLASPSENDWSPRRVSESLFSGGGLGYSSSCKANGRREDQGRLCNLFEILWFPFQCLPNLLYVYIFPGAKFEMVNGWNTSSDTWPTCGSMHTMFPVQPSVRPAGHVDNEVHLLRSIQRHPEHYNKSQSEGEKKGSNRT